MKTIDRKEVFELADNLLKHPELGYKEFETKKILVEYLKGKGFKIENECFETGFTISIGEGKPHIGLIAELDAIPTLGHKYANKLDLNAAHACGHHSQCVAMALAITLLKEEKLNGKVTLFFTPAEEYTDVNYRKTLIQEKKIKYIGGKINMLESGMFDDVDLFIHLHAMSASNYKFSIGSSLGCFLYKKITFKGKAAHAAICPSAGINALNEYALFNNAINMLRETFKEEDTIRVHGFISQGGQTVNSIPEEVIYECYVRSNNEKALIETSKKVDNAANHCALALGGNALIETSPGYLSLFQDKKINEVIYKYMLDYAHKEEIEIEHASMAAGDIGDISVFKPCVQFGYGGFQGVPHAKDFEVINSELVYISTAEIIYKTVLYLLNNHSFVDEVCKNYQPRMSKKDYLEYINQK